jgi:hypothetical protein
LGVYEVVTVSGGVFMPSALKGLSLAGGYEAFDVVAKAVDEPYSATGDLDGDGITNLVEYQNIVALGGTPEEFANSANDVMNDGTQLPGGEGEGDRPLCGASWRDGAPISNGVGDVALLILCVGALLFHQRRRTGERVVAQMSSA